MNRLTFLLAKLTRNEAALQAMSRPVEGELTGKRVALIGNARSLSQGGFGPRIDAHDLVIRINNAPIPDTATHGARTDWMAMSMPAPRDIIAARAPSRLLWMTRKRKRLPWGLVSDQRFFLNPVENVTRLRSELGAPPTTGAMLIDLLVRSDATEISLFGFDFFKSLSLSGNRTAAQVKHDFTSEADWVARLIETDPRLKLCRADADTTEDTE
ncbi:glycosyltransferase family 29 protein [Shimia biformata]|uniref:glycosyltransferase family 29 protein n=1 Tax=Shimia biformata TaxID=1294299 RepID=UPI00194EA9EA|nr:glycosyltransferase family 29 protein [Shimia biformata]